MTYRDSFESCPRCGVALVDARSARACPACRGLWISEQVVTEMVLAMLPPRPLSRLVLAVIERTGAPIGCPNCGEPMAATMIHQIVLDHCPRHGIWFDGEELEIALQRVAEVEREPPLASISAGATFLRPGELTFAIEVPGHPQRTVTLGHDIIKIGRMAAHLHLDDPEVSRFHAIVQQGEWVELIDLGASGGTRVNGAPITRAVLRSGDRIEVGGSVLTVTVAE